MHFGRRCGSLAAALLALTLAWVGRPAVAGATDFEGFTLRRVEIEGNAKTKPDVIQTIAGLKEGQLLYYADIRKAKIRLLSSGLFSRVNVYAVPEEVSKTAKVVILVQEKASYFIAPFGGAAISNISLGVAAGEQNLAGFGKRIFFLGTLSTGKSIAFLTFWDPALFQSPLWWRLELMAESYNVREYGSEWLNGPCAGGAPELLEHICRHTRLTRIGGVANLGMNWTRAFSTFLAWRFFRVAIDNLDVRPFRFKRCTTDAPEFCGPPTEIDGERGLDTSLRAGVSFDDRTDIDGMREGRRLEVVAELALPALGSSFPFARFEARGNVHFLIAEKHNVVFAGVAGYSLPLRMSGVPDVAYTATPYFRAFRLGGSALRGYAFDYFRGDTLMALQTEWVFPLFPVKNFIVRGVVFADAGAAWYSGLARPPADRGDCVAYVVPSGAPVCSSLNHGRPIGGVGAGVGIRLYLRTVVLPLVGLDLAYGFIGTGRFPDGSGLQVILSIGGTDV